MIFGIFIALVPIALLIALQVWLCRKGTRLGLILPILSLLVSLMMVFSMGAFTMVGSNGTQRLEQDGTLVQEWITKDGIVTVYDGEGNVIDQYPDPNHEANSQLTRNALGALVIVFLVTNIPTVVFGGIWLHYKGRRDTLDDLERMRIEDLG